MTPAFSEAPGEPSRLKESGRWCATYFPTDLAPRRTGASFSPRIKEEPESDIAGGDAKDQATLPKRIDATTPRVWRTRPPRGHAAAGVPRRCRPSVARERNCQSLSDAPIIEAR